MKEVMEPNFMKLQFAAKSQNESFARITVAAFVSQLDPTMEELTDIKTVVSEAVTNAIIHGYVDRTDGVIFIEASLEGETLHLKIKDEGVGIEDLELAQTPLYTSKPELERSGMGFTIMQNFMDQVHITSEENQGTVIEMRKKIKSKTALFN